MTTLPGLSDAKQRERRGPFLDRAAGSPGLPAKLPALYWSSCKSALVYLDLLRCQR